MLLNGNLPLKYASQVSAQILWQEIRVHTLLFEHVMQSHLLRMHEIFTLGIQCHFDNVSLKRLKRLSQFITHLSNFRLNIIAKQLVVDVEDNVV